MQSGIKRKMFQQDHPCPYSQMLINKGRLGIKCVLIEILKCLKSEIKNEQMNNTIVFPEY